MKTINILLIIFLFIGLGSGCAENPNNAMKDNGITKVQNVSMDQSLSNKAKEKVTEMEDITEAKAVNADKELVLAVKIKQLRRFQIKSIEKKVKTNLKKWFPNEKIEASTDLKIFLELGELEDKLQENDTNPKKLKKELQKIKNLMKEKT
ncbi:YhcN/YlaJ family sporulation lipoprotein [Salibacterium aidingense]|uniref:YhcN/YlaJ family sporulation lipoprotein n=1 Tax=Salibacterium aidingense TaxID=384933 RepID=UPI00047EA410|nr:YhcN/YlaJ family sporulation lipoprotein [Salibacterium aidingense]